MRMLRHTCEWGWEKIFQGQHCRVELVRKMSQEDNSPNVTFLYPQAHGSWRNLSYFRETQVKLYSFHQFTQGLN